MKIGKDGTKIVDTPTASLIDFKTTLEMTKEHRVLVDNINDDGDDFRFPEHPSYELQVVFLKITRKDKHIQFVEWEPNTHLGDGRN